MTRLIRKMAVCLGLLALPAHDGLAFLRPAPPAPTPAPPATNAGPKGDPAKTPVHHGFVDPAGPAGTRLQRPDDALRGLPRDADGRVDWVQALRDGRITPRSDVLGALATEPFDKDVLLKNTRAMPWVKFPHRAHTEWLDCSNCHPDPFPAGQAPFTTRMESIFRGQACGKCHDRVAFVTHRNCYRCHSVPQPGASGVPIP